MKKILAEALFVAAVLCLFSCARKNSADASSGKKWIVTTDTDFRPFEYTNEKKQLVGIDIDILAAVAKDQGFEYELRAWGWDDGITAVREGRADALIAGATITEERIGAGWIFSNGYYNATQTFVVGKESQITRLDDLFGKKVAVKNNTAGMDFALSLKEKYGFEIRVFDDSPAMYQDVILGESDACVEDTPIIASNIKDASLPFKIPIGMESPGAPYGFVIMNPENRELLEMFNKGLENIRAKGTYQKILNKYL